MKVNALAFAVMLEYLVDNPNSSYQEIADHSGLHYITVRDWLSVWRKRKLVYVSGYDPDTLGRPNIMLFTFGRGRDVKKTKKTDAVRAQEYRERKRRKELQAAIEGRA